MNNKVITIQGIVLNTKLDIVNFDAFFFAHNFSLFSDDIEKFLNRDGIIAWGIVPTLDVDALENTNINELIDIFEINLLLQYLLSHRYIVHLKW